MQQALIITQGKTGWGFRAAPDLPVEALLLGKPAEQAASLLPRLFNLCAAAQSMGARLALGLPVADDNRLGLEILRDHLLKLCVIWPTLLGMKPLALPHDPMALDALHLPAGGVDYFAWTRSQSGLAPVLAAIAHSFAPGEAVADLPLMRPETALDRCAQDNSVAARNAAHPAMQAIAARFGHGPFWRASALIFDIATLRHTTPQARICADGTVVVPAARGAYALRARSAAGVVSGFARRTPTDHLCAANGVLQRSLDSLPPAKPHLLPLLIDILAPCVAVQLPQVHHA
ncbi:MAG: HupK protein [Paracoccaceae bacterium]|nr:HupK protein [Paracoccaceae bacterium]